MLIRTPDPIKAAEITDPEHWKQRRTFLRASLVTAGGLWLAPQAPARQAGERIPGLIKSPLSTEEKPTSFEDITSYNNFYELGGNKQIPA